MKAYVSQISLGNWITIAVLFGGFVLQWGAFGARIADHTERLFHHEEALQELKALASGNYTTTDAHREQRATDGKLSDIGQRVTRIEEGVTNIKTTLMRIEQQTKP